MKIYLIKNVEDFHNSTKQVQTHFKYLIILNIKKTLDIFYTEGTLRICENMQKHAF